MHFEEYANIVFVHGYSNWNTDNTDEDTEIDINLYIKSFIFFSLYEFYIENILDAKIWQS